MYPRSKEESVRLWVSHAGQAMTPEMGCSRRPEGRVFLMQQASINFVAVSKLSFENTGLNQF
jgi:hypothetical protein